MDKITKDKIINELENLYHGSKTALVFKNPFELLIATVLSAQCTDRQVNKVTKILFNACDTPEKMAAMEIDSIQDIIKSCGFYRTKAKNIHNLSRMLVERYDSKVPDNLQELQKLPGVGRKTANVVVSNAFGQDAIAVDTHVFRVSNRLGIVCAKNVYDTEKQLMDTIPKEKWSEAHHWLIYHGRNVCNARKPKCSCCTLNCFCKYYKDHN